MTDVILHFLQEKAIPFTDKQAITVVTVPSAKEGEALASDVLYHLIDKETLLLLSGGKTPKELYRRFTDEKKLLPGSVALIDERYGKKFHDNSNEKMIWETGLLEYLKEENIPVYLPLQDDITRLEAAESYDKTLRELFLLYWNKIGILGIGSDGHTAGIPSRDSDFITQHPALYVGSAFVADYHDKKGMYGERISMTFAGLSQLDLFLVLVFGEDKQKALELVFTHGSEEEIPGRFYTRPQVARKTLLITDRTDYD